MEQVVHMHDITSGSVEIGLDGEAAIKSILKPFTSESAADYDILWLIHHITKSLPIKTTFRWIKGHQLKFKSVEELDIWARLNEMADQLAKKYWESTKSRTLKHNLRLTPYSLHYNQEWLRTYRPKEIYNELRGDPTLDYWGDHGSPGITNDSINLIDWHAYHRSVKPMSFGIKLFIIKGMSGFDTTGRYMERTYGASQ